MEENIPLYRNIQIREEDIEGYRSYSLPSSQKITLVVVLTLSMSSMGIFLYLQSVSFPCEQYLLAQLYTVFYVLLYTVTYFALLGRDWRGYLEKFSLQHVALIGFFWVTNYTFVLISSSYISNFMQILIVQLQILVVTVIDHYFVGIKMSSYKIISIATYLSGSMLAIGLDDIFWTFIFFVGIIASGMANIYSEIYMKTLVVTHSPFIDKIKCVVAINMLSNLVGIPITFLAIPLGKYAIGLNAPLYDFSIFNRNEIWYLVGLLFSSYLYTLCSYPLLHSESTVYATMCMGVGLFLQLCFFMTPATSFMIFLVITRNNVTPKLIETLFITK